MAWNLEGVYRVRIENALRTALQFGQIDGDHHKMWVIDRMVRELCGSIEAYEKWVEKACDGGEYDWDVGIAP